MNKLGSILLLLLLAILVAMFALAVGDPHGGRR